jgi:hypothetical protein
LYEINNRFYFDEYRNYKRLDDENEIGMGKVMQPFRLSLVGLKGPHLFDIVELIGKRNDHKNSKAVASL